ncbi:hypothetical protein DL95DRAFT_150129 [Leptodontidium sp. 2 PMI_412]|nr:hypothetical protein DL95DRAFT_150129 [Leptodontidium sp. 2 PMI_412]
MGNMSSLLTAVENDKKNGGFRMGWMDGSGFGDWMDGWLGYGVLIYPARFTTLPSPLYCPLFSSLLCSGSLRPSLFLTRLDWLGSILDENDSVEGRMVRYGDALLLCLRYIHLMALLASLILLGSLSLSLSSLSFLILAFGC